MSLTVTQTGSDFETAPQGAFAARCCQVIDLGIKDKGGAYPGRAHQVRLAFEIDELDSDGKRFLVSEHFTASLSERAKLYKLLVSWRGRAFSAQELEGFDLKNVAGKPCLVNIVHKQSGDGTRTYANIASISPLPKGMPEPGPVTELIVWEYGNAMSVLPEWAHRLIGDDPNAEAAPALPPNDPSLDDDDSIPF